MTPEPLSIVCAWCRRVLVAGGRVTSHSICAPCQARLHAEMDQRQTELVVSSVRDRWPARDARPSC